MHILEHFFDDLTEQFAKPATLTDSPQPYDIEMAGEAIKAMSQLPGEKLTPDCRVYLDGRRASPFEGKQFIDEIAAFDDLAKVPWETLAGGAPFLIFVNKASLFSRRMDQATRRLLGRFCERFEPDGLSIEHHIIIGQYNETDFGVHVDDPADRVFHFNLGPASKEMILWPRVPFTERYGPNPTRSLASTSSKGSVTHPMPPGSCFFLPADYYHVGLSPSGVSIVAAIALSRQSSEQQLSAVFREITNSVAPIEDITPYWTNFSLAPTQRKQEKISTAFARHDYAGWLRHARARARSNGWISEIRPLPTPRIPEGIFDLHLSDSISPQLVVGERKLHLYAMGQHIILSDAETIEWFQRYKADKVVRLTRDEVVLGLKHRDPRMVVAAWLIASGAAVPKPVKVLETAKC